MVLDDASNPAPSPDFTSEATPSSDLDQYAGSNAEYLESRPSSYIRVTDTNPPLYVNGANLPFPLFTYRRDGVEAKVYKHYETQLRAITQFAAKALQRPVTQAEADALSFTYAASFRISSYGLPLGLAAGMLQFVRTWRTFRFPFWSPFREGGKLSPDRFGTLRGRNAQRAWHVARGSAYAFVGGIFMGPTFSGLYATSTTISARAKDPRLKELREALALRTKQGRQQNTEASVQQRQSMEETERANQRGESLEMWRMRKQAEMQDARRRQGSATSNADDMSPTGGAFAEETRLQSDGFISDDWQSPQEAQPWQDSTTRSAISNTSSAQPTSQTQGSTSPSARQTQSPNKQSGSAWDRLRQDAMSNSGPADSSASSRSARTGNSNAPRSTDSSSDGNSFSFSEGEEEKQLAKSEAQQEFDARIEREREGKNFDDRKGGSKRW